MDYTLGNIKIHIANDYNELSKKGAELVAEQINSKPESNMGFATGGTPVGMYKELVKMNKANTVDFSKITTFNLDEYYPIKKSNNQSYDYFMKDNLFNHVNVDKTKLHIPNGEAPDVKEECLNYEKQIKEAGGIDFQILGIGNNGHIGFNEPEAFFTATTNYVDLVESTIEANARFFESRDEVPKNAISMGIKTIMMANKILMLASGASKADIIYKTLFGNITPEVPASVLQLHQNVTMILDKDSASKVIDILNK